MRTLIWSGMLAGFLGLMFAAMDQAQGAVRICGERAKMVQMLKTKYKEAPRAIGVSATGKSTLEIYTNKKGSWTALQTKTSGMACIVGAGHSWQLLSPILPKT